MQSDFNARFHVFRPSGGDDSSDGGAGASTARADDSSDASSGRGWLTKHPEKVGLPQRRWFQLAGTELQYGNGTHP